MIRPFGQDRGVSDRHIEKENPDVIFRTRLAALLILVALVLAAVLAATTADEARAERTENTSIQILAIANVNGELEECG